MVSRVLVLGVGNILLSDEGAGVRVVEKLLEGGSFSPLVELIDGGTMGLELLPYLDEKSHLYIVDAIQSPEAPGTLLVQELDDPPAYFRQRISPHQIGLSELLAVAAMQDSLPRFVKLVGIVPLDLSTGLELSPPVAEAVSAAVSVLRNEIVALTTDFVDL